GHLLSNQRAWGPEQVAAIENELHDALRVLVRRLQQQIAHHNVDVELLLDFASQCGDVRFAVGNLSARELPESGQMDAVLTTGHQKTVFAFYDGGNDEKARHRAGF